MLLQQERAMRARPQCYADRESGTIDVGGGPFAPPASFFAEVADAKAVADAAKYVNNVERFVGTVKVPVGLIGPLRVRMDDDPRPDREELLDKVYHVPMATTEGVLLASYQRGAKAITSSGGAWASVTSRQMVRAPAFTFKSVRAASAFLKWFRASGVERELEAAIATQPHCALVRLEAKITDRSVHVHVGIDSEDAAGQNMVRAQRAGRAHARARAPRAHVTRPFTPCHAPRSR
jgi:hydroxymethylglutaryl-CoA reductase (NADPH)